MLQQFNVDNTTEIVQNLASRRVQMAKINSVIWLQQNSNTIYTIIDGDDALRLCPEADLPYCINILSHSNCTSLTTIEESIYLLNLSSNERQQQSPREVKRIESESSVASSSSVADYPLEVSNDASAITGDIEMNVLNVSSSTSEASCDDSIVNPMFASSKQLTKDESNQSESLNHLPTHSLTHTNTNLLT